MTDGLIIRTENPGDVAAIASVTELAFRDHPISQNTEHFIVNALRRAGALSISLVAELEGEVVGHIAFSPLVVSDGTRDWYTLGPLSVTPKRQGRGIGSALVREGLAALRDLGGKGCFLVGNPAYYQRFGFASRPDLVVPGVPREVCQSITLEGAPATGEATHHEAFSARE